MFTSEPVARVELTLAERLRLFGGEFASLAVSAPKMVLYRLLPHVEHYTGVDLSSHALNTIQQELSPAERERVVLQQQPAHALDGIADRSCDTVVINSVAQYFPDAAYLEKVLRRASEIVTDGGSIFVGDVRGLEQFEAFHLDVTLQQSPDTSSKADVASRFERRLAQDGILDIRQLCERRPRDAGHAWGGANGDRLWYLLHGIELPEKPTRRSKAKASVKAARSRNEVKRELVSSSSDWKPLCWPRTKPSDFDAL